MQRQPDVALARKLLDWSPTVDLDEGLRRTIDYFRELLAKARGSNLPDSR